ncbi:MAG: hypothetical protein PSN04_07460 [Methyloprofundus sp.]|nr:hypothetical protein [Methyloprofundus sp.]
MSDALYFLTLVYGAYVIYTVTAAEETPKKVRVTADKAFKPLVDVPAPKEDATTTPAKEKKVVEAIPAKAEKKNPEPLAVVEHTAPKRIVAAKKKPSKRKAAPKIELRTVLMTHPETGEEAKVTNNYRMTKRWVKEALVTEGLLEKIYKNTELDDPAKIKVAQALSIIKAMDKYKVFSK